MPLTTTPKAGREAGDTLGTLLAALAALEISGFQCQDAFPGEGGSGNVSSLINPEPCCLPGV